MAAVGRRRRAEAQAETQRWADSGAHPPGWAAELLLSKDRSKNAPTFGPEGLYLEKIEYESRWGLPQ